MRLPAFLQRLGRSRDARVPVADPPAVAVGPIRMTCALVDDFDVMRDDPTAITTTLRVFDWHDEPPGHERLMGVFEVANAILVPGYQPIDPARGVLIANHCYHNLFGAGTDTMREQPAYELDIETIEDVAGRVAVIGGMSSNNYFHGLMQWYARLALLHRLAPHVFDDPAVRFLIDEEARSGPFAGMIEALGVPPERIVWSDNRKHYRIERAVLTSFVHEGDICPELYAIVAERVRAVLGIETRQRGTRRIWISREHIGEPRRRVANIDEVADLLDGHGFERVAMEELSFADQVRLMCDAEVVSGSHGAGYANMIFTPPECRFAIIEKDFAIFLKIIKLFSNLAIARGQQVEIVPARSGERPNRDYGEFIEKHFADAIVDRDRLAAAFERLAPVRTAA